MALWNGLGQAATVAQLSGVDASGLISMILEAVRTVKRNKEECKRLAEQVAMIGELLHKLLGSDMMQDPAMRKPLQGLDDTLRKAYRLITSCRDSNIVYNFFMGWKQAEKFREVEKNIDSYLQFYPVISHTDITRRLTQISDRRPNPSSSRTKEASTNTSSSSIPPSPLPAMPNMRPPPPPPPSPPARPSPLNTVSHLAPWESLSAPQTPMRLGAFANFPAQTWGDDGYCSGVEERVQTRQGPYSQGYQKDLLQQWSASRPGTTVQGTSHICFWFTNISANGDI
ncbi:Protein MID1-COMPLEMENTING ACTIVITY 1 [Dichanthelium oligosanthes]|uniref:Protein MID1-COMPLEMENTING ACTIVITY 1 n=1 Tax=Dichanthelium oligosanthes TaxID=888268 RepID=A0A1E5VXG0_9POAL|nr:Protein MID1-COMPLEMENTING ACTIVITY 1 [Dichanthelium oligosanthes]